MVKKTSRVRKEPTPRRPPESHAGMKVLVANRGEIACRILKTLREMGIPSVAIHADVESEAPHVMLADEAVPIGEPNNYLDAGLIVRACRARGVTAVHPGYGYLSQNAGFARACGEAGITFIGPSPETMEVLGDKRAARRAAEECGVPVVPGELECDTLEAVRAAAAGVGLPVLIKAAGGGGGKGMRLVRRREEIAEAFAAARREAVSSFADGRLVVEKFVSPARHVEVQVLGDGRNAVALGERECSLQRRYQKVIEEGPSTGVTDTTRRALLAAAVRLARHARYTSAGTVEFLIGPDGAHHFLEVNTRLQVEHPVTEALLGLDIVRAQVEIARGGALPQPPPPRGHAIEARLYAEDPARGFLPTGGRVLSLDWPHHPGVRIDSGIRQESEVLPFFDPLLAKLIAWGEDREQARRRLIEALREMTLLGVVTNQAFLLQVLTSDLFVEGRTFTTTLESTPWREPEVPEEAREAARRALASRTRIDGTGHADPYSPWDPAEGRGAPA